MSQTIITDVFRNSFRFLLPVMGFLMTAQGASPYESLLQSYDLLTTVAGMGGNCVSDVSGWQSAFEGGSALQVNLSSPHMSMADSAGNIYIADKDAHAIRKVDTKGIITTIAGTSVAGDGGKGIATDQALSSPNGVWVNKKGEFYILDLGNNKVRKVDLQRNMTTVLHDTAGMTVGRGLWVSKAEDTIWYATGSEIRMWTKQAGIVVYASGFSALGNIVQDKNGFIVATDRSAHLVYRLDKQGNKTKIAGNDSASGGGEGFPALQTAFYGVRGVWFLDDNSYFLATHEGSKVWYVDTGGIAHVFLNGLAGDAYHGGDGENYQTSGFKVSEVRAVTVDYQGNVLVTENDCGYIRKVAKRKAGVLLNYVAPRDMSMRLSTNPSSGLTRLSWTSSDHRQAKVRILSEQGRMQRIPLAYHRVADKHEIQWQSRYLPNGVYFVRLESDRISVTRKYVLLH